MMKISQKSITPEHMQNWMTLAGWSPIGRPVDWCGMVNKDTRTVVYKHVGQEISHAENWWVEEYEGDPEFTVGWSVADDILAEAFDYIWGNAL
jgi:hypothetical protein